MSFDLKEVDLKELIKLVNRNISLKIVMIHKNLCALSLVIIIKKQKEYTKEKYYNLMTLAQKIMYTFK